VAKLGEGKLGIGVIQNEEPGKLQAEISSKQKWSALGKVGKAATRELNGVKQTTGNLRVFEGMTKSKYNEPKGNE